MNEAIYMNSSLPFLMNNAVLVWLTVTATLFLVIPGLIAAVEESFHTYADIHFKAHLYPTHPRYPHYLLA